MHTFFNSKCPLNSMMCVVCLLKGICVACLLNRMIRVVYSTLTLEMLVRNSVCDRYYQGR